MATTRKASLSEIKDAMKDAKAPEAASTEKEAAVSNDAPKYERKVDEKGRAYATGRRKDAVARVRVLAGNGKITVNGKDVSVYFARPVLQMILNQPFEVAQREGQFDVVCTVNGGGLSGQAGAVKHGISRALCNFEPELRSKLKKAGFLTRDARVVERKKPGQPKARKKSQFSKR